MDRREKLLEIGGDGAETVQIVEEILFLERQMEEVKKLPFIKTNPQNPKQQKSLPAGKLYRELLGQYNSCIRLFAKLTGNDVDKAESPLRKWVEEKRNADTG